MDLNDIDGVRVTRSITTVEIDTAITACCDSTDALAPCEGEFKGQVDFTGDIKIYGSSDAWDGENDEQRVLKFVYLGRRLTAISGECGNIPHEKAVEFFFEIRADILQAILDGIKSGTFVIEEEDNLMDETRL